MNCLEARERLSALLDESLDSSERSDIRAHMEGCPDCRLELDRLRATLSLLSRVDRPRAPVGFVDRVMTAAHRAPWYRSFGHRLFLPLAIKLPVQAAAMLVIAVFGVYLLQHTPELRDAARVEREAPASRSEPLATSTAARDGGRLDAPKSSAPSTGAYQQEPKKEADAGHLQKPAAPASQAAPAPEVAASGPPAPAAPPAESREKGRNAAEGQSGALADEPPAMTAKRQSPTASVLGRLNVKSRPAAEQGLADLLSGLGGIETGRRRELGATVVEVLVPEGRYADFVHGLTTLGAWSPEGQPAALPTDPPKIHVSIRISE